MTDEHKAVAITFGVIVIAIFLMAMIGSQP